MKRRMMEISALVLIASAVVLFSVYLSEQSKAPPQDIGIRTLRVGVIPKLSSYCYMNEQGLPEGFNIDVMNAIALEMGINIEWYEIRDSEVLLSIITGMVDCVYGVDYNHIPAEDISVSTPFFDNKVTIFIPKGTEDIKGFEGLKSKKISVYRRDPYINIIEATENSGIYMTDDIETAVGLMMYDISDVYVGDKNIGIDYISSTEYKDKIKTIGDQSCQWMSSIVTLNDDAAIIDGVNYGYQSIVRKGTFDTIKSKWFGQSIEQPNQTVRKFIAVTGIIVMVAMLIMLIFYRINRMLKREVEDRTMYLNEEKKLKESIINSIFDGLIYIDKNGQILLTNPSAVRILGEEGSIINRDLFSVKGAELFDRNSVKGVIHEKESKLSQESRIVSGGEDKHIEYNMTPVIQDSGDVTGLTLTFKDVTEEKKMMQKLIDSDKLEMIGRMTAGIAHEIRNPLSAISMYVKLLPQKIDSQAFREQILEDIPKEIRRLDNLIKTLLDYARPAMPKKELFNLDEEIQSVIRLMASQLKEKKGVKLIKRIDDGLEIMYDRQQFRQIVMNVIINAIDATADTEEPYIRIEGFSCNEDVVLEISDNGPGIPSDLAKKIFEPFVTTKADGYGLGLSVVGQLAKENNSVIEVDENYSDGAKFVITIPTYWR